MIKILTSEWLKTKRTAIRWLTFFMPVAVALCIVAYLSVRGGTTQGFIYEGFFTVWTAILIPVGVGLFSAYIIHEEEMAGNFNGLLNTGVSRTQVYLGKFLLLIFCLVSCTFISTVLLCLGMEIVIPEGGSIPLFLAAAALAVIGALPIISIHLWISFVWGMGASIGLSLGGILMAALVGAASIGGKLWFFVPWAWPVKMSMIPYFYHSNSETALFSEVSLQLIIQLSLTVITLTVFLTAGILWFRKWEGRTGE